MITPLITPFVYLFSPSSHFSISYLIWQEVPILFFLDILSGKVWFVLVSSFIYYFWTSCQLSGVESRLPAIYYILGSLPLPTWQSPLQEKLKCRLNQEYVHSLRRPHECGHTARCFLGTLHGSFMHYMLLAQRAFKVEFLTPTINQFLSASQEDGCNKSTNDSSQYLHQSFS